MARSTPRPQTPDLSSAAGETGLRTTARVNDRFMLSRTARIRPSLIDFAGFSERILKTFAKLTTLEGEADQESGVAGALEAIAEAEKDAEKTQERLAGLVAKGDLEEHHNPAYIAGYRKTLARELASRWYTSSVSQIDGAAFQAILPDSETGIPAATQNPDNVEATTFQKLRQKVAQLNPTLADDPWFKRELLKEHARLQPKLSVYAQKKRLEALQEENTNKKTAHLIEGLNAFNGGSMSAEDLNKIISKYHLEGVKDLPKMTFDAVRAAYIQASLAADSNGNPLPNATVNAEKVLATMAASVRINDIPLNRGILAAQVAQLQRQAFAAKETDARVSASDKAKRLDSMYEGQEGDEKSTWTKITTAKSQAAAQALFNAARDELMAPGAWSKGNRHGVSARGDAPEQIEHWQAAVDLHGENKKKAQVPLYDNFLDQLDQGSLTGARTILEQLSGTYRVQGRAELRAFNEVSPMVFGVQANQGAYRHIASVSSAVNTGTEAGDATTKSEIAAVQTRLSRNLRNALVAIAPDQRAAWMAGEGAKMLTAATNQAREIGSNANADYADAVEPVFAAWEHSEDGTAIINKLQEDGVIDRATWISLSDRNKAETKIHSVWEDQSRVYANAFTKELTGILTNPTAVQGGSGKVITGTFITNFPGAPESLAKADQRMTPDLTGRKVTYGGIKVQLTQHGVNQLRLANKLIYENIKAWLRSPEAAAVKKGGGVNMLEQHAKVRLRLLETQVRNKFRQKVTFAEDTQLDPVDSKLQAGPPARVPTRVKRFKSTDPTVPEPLKSGAEVIEDAAKEREELKTAKTPPPPVQAPGEKAEEDAPPVQAPGEKAEEDAPPVQDAEQKAEEDAQAAPVDVPGKPVPALDRANLEDQNPPPGDLVDEGGTTAEVGRHGGAAEKEFQEFYKQQAEKWGLNPDPDAPLHKYDYRAAWQAGEAPDDEGHWPSKYKHPDHPNRFVEDEAGDIIDTLTGKKATLPQAIGWPPATEAVAAPTELSRADQTSLQLSKDLMAKRKEWGVPEEEGTFHNPTSRSKANDEQVGVFAMNWDRGHVTASPIFQPNHPWPDDIPRPMAGWGKLFQTGSSETKRRWAKNLDDWVKKAEASDSWKTLEARRSAAGGQSHGTFTTIRNTGPFSPLYIKTLTGDSPEIAGRSKAELTNLGYPPNVNPGTVWGQVFWKSDTLQHAGMGLRGTHGSDWILDGGGHPYYMQMAMLHAAASKADFYPSWKKRTIQNSLNYVEKMMRRPRYWQDAESEEYAYHNAMRFIGAAGGYDYKAILAGEVKIAGAMPAEQGASYVKSRHLSKAAEAATKPYRSEALTLPLDNPQWVLWQVTPLFESEDQLRSVAADDPNTLRKLMRKLGIPHSNESDIREQQITKLFLRYQRDAIRSLP